MPTHSLDEALAWREANIGYRLAISDRPTPTQPAIYDIAAARAKRETHEANLAAMREAKEAGALVERARVVQGATDAGALLRRSLERLPALAEELSALPDPAAIRARLTAAVAAALADLADNLARLGAPAETPDGRR